MIAAWLARLRRPKAAPDEPGDDRRRRGKTAEDLAAARVKREGGRIVARNWRCKLGELDLIVWERKILAFVEVKSRESDEFGRPSDGVNRAKRRRIERLALAFCRQRRLDPETQRFDIIEVIWTEPPAVEWLRGAWRVGD
jgi:putative endonuclease